MEELIEHIETDMKGDEKYRFLAETLGQLVRELHKQVDETQSCQKEWQVRIGRVEFILNGANGGDESSDGLRGQMHSHNKDREGINKRIERIEYILTGADGGDGVRLLLHNTVADVTQLEKKVSMLVTRATTTLVLTQAMILPLVLWIFHYFTAP